MSESNQQESRRSGLLGWMFAHPKFSIALFLFLLIICAGVAFDQVAKGRVERQIAAMRAAGMPTTIKDLVLAMPEIPDDQNMTIPILEQAIILTGIKITEEIRPHLRYVGTANAIPSGRRLPSEQLEAAHWYLNQAAPALPIIHKALKLERGCVDVQWKTPAIMVVIDELSQFRLVSQVLALEATVAAEDGDSERAAEVLLDLLRMDRAQECETFLIGALVRFAIDALPYDRIEHTINLCGMSETSLQRVQTVLQDREGADYYKKSLIGERVMFIDTMQWFRTAPNANVLTLGFGGGAVSSAGMYWKYLPILPDLDEAAGIAFYNSLVDAVDQPDANTIDAIKASDLCVANIPKYCIVTRTLMPSISRSAELWVRVVAENRALQAAIATERYRLATGEWPTTLDTLVPDYLSAIPVDPFDGKPLRYSHIDEGIKIWSIGEDLVDDHGDIGPLTKRQYSNRPKDWGWPLLNPDLRGRPLERDVD